MHKVARLVLVGLVSWQAIAAAWAHGERVVAATSATDWRHVLLSTSDERIARVLGADYDVLAGLRTCPPGTVVLHQRVGGSIEELRQRYPDEQALIAAFQNLAARNGLFLQLTAFAYPRPCLLGAVDPIALAEAEAKAGRERWLLVLPGDPEPRDRAGWVAVSSSARFSVWRCSTGS